MKREVEAAADKLAVLQDLHNTTEGVWSGKSQILSTKPVLKADAPLPVQGLLRKLDHQQGSLDVEPILEQGVSLHRAGGGGESLEDIFPGAPEQTLEDASGIRNEDPLGRVGIEEAASQLLQAPGVGGTQRDARKVCPGVFLFL